MDFNVRDKKEDNEDIRDEIDGIFERFNKKSDYEWSESSDADFLDENNSSSNYTESDEKSTARTSATQNPTVNSQNIFRWIKKQPCSFETSFKGEHVPSPPVDSLSSDQYFETFFDDNLIEDIKEQTNLYSVQTSSKSINVTTDEMGQYFSIFVRIFVRMSVIKLPQLRMYWAQRTQVSSAISCQLIDLKKLDNISTVINGVVYDFKVFTGKNNTKMVKCCVPSHTNTATQ